MDFFVQSQFFEFWELKKEKEESTFSKRLLHPCWWLSKKLRQNKLKFASMSRHNASRKYLGRYTRMKGNQVSFEEKSFIWKENVSFAFSFTKYDFNHVFFYSENARELKISTSVLDSFPGQRKWVVLPPLYAIDTFPKNNEFANNKIITFEIGILKGTLLCCRYVKLPLYQSYHKGHLESILPNFVFPNFLILTVMLEGLYII